MTSEQTGSDARRLALYVSPGCFYCSRVLRAVEALGADVEVRDTMRDPQHRAALWQAMGRGTVPVLRIQGPGGEDRWLPESRDIIEWLQQHVGRAPT